MHLNIAQCTGLCQHRRPDGTVCGKELDTKGVHARACAVGGWLIRRHDAGCAVLAAWMEDLGCTVYREVVLPQAAVGRPEARMDLVVHSPRLSGPVFVDLAVVSALSKEALRARSCTRDGAAAGIATRRKAAAYPDIAMVPFAIEDHGRLGEEALHLVRILAPEEPSRRSASIRGLYQSLGNTLQRYAADSLLAATTTRR